MKHHKTEKTSKGIKAVPFFRAMYQFAFLNDLPFFTYNDQLQVINIYKDSIKKAGKRR